MYLKLAQILLTLTFVLTICIIQLLVKNNIKKIFDLLKIQVFLNGTSFFLYLYNYANSNFYSVDIVNCTHHSLPLFYKIGAIWSHNIGSWFLWCFLLNSITLIWYAHIYRSQNNIKILFLLIQLNIQLSFLLPLLILLNPFTEITFFCLQGNDLNPILQNPILIIHPPILYLGYALTFIIFSYTAVLYLNSKSRFEIKNLYKITLFAWYFITIGIGLGSWWAYHELGWGGWWFWDPVENFSLITWLSVTLFLHHFYSSEWANYWKTLFRSTIAPLSVLLGFFLTRTGILNSVHSFNTDKSIYYVIIITIAFIFASTLWIFTYKINYTVQFNFMPIKNKIKENIKQKTIYLDWQPKIIYIYVIFLVLSILFPIFFNGFNLDLELYSIISTGLAITIISLFFLHKLVEFKKKYTLKLFLFFLVSLFILTYVWKYNLNYNLRLIDLQLLFFLNAFIILNNVIKNKKKNLYNDVHFWIFLLISLIVCAATQQYEYNLLAVPGIGFQLDQFLFNLRGLNILDNTVKNQLYLLTDVNINGIKSEFNLFPSKSFFFEQGVFNSRASLLSNYFYDLYLYLGEGNPFNGYLLKGYYNQFVGLFLPVFILIVCLISFRLKKLFNSTRNNLKINWY
uniref:Heme lyase n=1 Tax=Ancoracysta twista TaxID=2044563 RepID=A0A2H4R8G7_9EUKA|nr:heme lyase [Ancoracysta twista]ATY40949.1 heme lyase [Ancoracysta twista]